jgi:hypothetical protein
MTKDPIIDEVREIRRKTEEACEGDWEKLFEHFLKVQKSSKRPVVSGCPRRLAGPARK